VRIYTRILQPVTSPRWTFDHRATPSAIFCAREGQARDKRDDHHSRGTLEFRFLALNHTFGSQLHLLTCILGQSLFLPTRRRNKLGSHFDRELETDIPRSACLARIGGRLLIEIDFGTETVLSPTKTDGGLRKRREGRGKTNASGEGQGIGALTRTWGYQISYRFNLAWDSWESRLYSPQFPRTIASSCCCWPIDSVHVKSLAHARRWPSRFRPLPHRNFLFACRYVCPLTRTMLTTRHPVTFLRRRANGLASTSIHSAAKHRRRLTAGDSQLCHELHQ